MKSDFEKARNEYAAFVESSETLDVMFHGPVDDRFWSEPFRLVIVNMESYGYQGINHVDEAMLKDWLYDAGGTKTRTVRYSTTLAAGILHAFRFSFSPDRNFFQAAYQNHDLLESTLQRIAYYNIRPDSNHETRQNINAIHSSGGSSIGNFVWNEITSLTPHIIIVSGLAGLNAVNKLISPISTIAFNGVCNHPDGYKIASIRHPSRPSYDSWSRLIQVLLK